LQSLQDVEVQDPGLPYIVTEDVAMPVFFRGPELVPQAPECAASQVVRDQTMKMRKALLSEDVDRQRNPDLVREPARPVLQIGAGLPITVLFPRQEKLDSCVSMNVFTTASRSAITSSFEVRDFPAPGS
jgi:hypothetical protein